MYTLTEQPCVVMKHLTPAKVRTAQLDLREGALDSISRLMTRAWLHCMVTL